MIESKCDRRSLGRRGPQCGRWAIHFGRGMTRHFARAAAVRPKFNALSPLFFAPLVSSEEAPPFFCNDSSLDTARCPNASLARSLAAPGRTGGTDPHSARWKSSQWNKASKVEFLDPTQWSSCDDNPRVGFSGKNSSFARCDLGLLFSKVPGSGLSSSLVAASEGDRR